MTDLAINPYLTPIDWGTAPAATIQPTDPGTGAIPMRPPVHIVQGQGPQHGAELAQAQPPTAIQTTPPPTPGVSAPALDPDEEEFKLGLKNDMDAFTKNKYSVLKGEPQVKPQLIDPAQDERIKEIEELRKLLPGMSPAERRRFNTEFNATQNRIMREIREKNTAAQRAADKQQADELRSANYKFQDPKARKETADVISSYIGPLIQKYTTGVDIDEIDPKTGKPKQLDMNDPKVKNDLEYTYRTSPLSTLKPVELRDTVTNIAMLNPSISNDMALKYALAIGSPIELRPDRRDPNAPTPNQRKGKGGANYQVLGSDPNRNMWVLQVGPQQLRIDDATYQRLVQARLVGYSTARKIMEEQAKAAAQPSMFDRAAKPVRENVIKPAEEFIQRFR
jgi:hypothetical protein